MELHDMKRTKTEIKERESDAPTSIGKNEYPYGLSINLEKESLDKLGLDIDDFNLDAKVDIVCQAEVSSTHESSNKHDTSASVSLQITGMAMKVQPNENKVTIKDVMTVIKGGL